MSGTRPIPIETRALQQRAADPAHSAWVSANAGSGKTHVLAQRVIRLLLADVPPAKILCLTFTKAAAANMSMRIFDTLSRWTRLDDAELSAAIGEVAPDIARGKNLAFARRLFARTVETPGGLKIQTIHAFCERLLHLFPFEANVAARFEVIEDATRAELLGRARAQIIARATLDEDGELGRSLRFLAGETSKASFDEVVDEALRQRIVLRDALRRAKGISAYRRALANRLGLGADETLAVLERSILEEGIAASRWSDIAERLGGTGSKTSTTSRLLLAEAETEALAKREAYLSVFLTKEREPRADTYLTKAARKAQTDLCLLLDRERDRLWLLLQKLKAAQTVERTCALVTLADAVLVEYERMKSSRGFLDFDDLIERTLDLLRNASAAWVLYKLDSGIDHILVDEAQDTSPQQWEILRKIAEEFTAGRGQRDKLRTFFAVGDEKQSIFSFQGAAPRMFDLMRKEFEKRAVEAEQNFKRVELKMSFRSATGVLATVDEVFSIEENFRGLSADPVRTNHEAWKVELPALVEIWEPIIATPQEEPRDWRLPLDHVGSEDPVVLLAGRIAKVIQSWISRDSDERIHDERLKGMRNIQAGDIMILVRTRGPFFEAMIRALKELHVPVAGADRLALTEHIAVMDLIAAGRAALLPEDDLTLACVLKSPLVGFDDDDLIGLAPARKGSLFEALCDSEEARHRNAAAKLHIWRRWASELTPFLFYTRLTGGGGGRRDLVGRLGPEAADAIDEFLRLALAHDREGPSSLTRFLADLETADISIKRDMETAGEAVRVMTVHAAKGLEAKIVFLPDTCDAPTGRHDPKLFQLDDGGATPLIAWTPRSAADPPLLAEARAARRIATHEEHRRLLYVAMTRAEERLYICGFHRSDNFTTGCWYETIVRGVSQQDFVSVPAPWGGEETILRRVWTSRPISDAPNLSSAKSDLSAALPDWLFRPAPAEPPFTPPVRPSNALAAADAFRRDDQAGIAASDRSRAVIAGRIVHELLQRLPAIALESRAAAAMRFVSARCPGLWDAERARIVERVLAVIDAPD
ncbi:MAG TPA: double-strand break repair helicase AddA, partial [Beijerinckiaceae bacterium]|nr:double-strand break repair helicase AddA [Beijerinckiaceae bacterium]